MQLLLMTMMLLMLQVLLLVLMMILMIMMRITLLLLLLLGTKSTVLPPFISVSSPAPAPTATNSHHALTARELLVCIGPLLYLSFLIGSLSYNDYNTIRSWSGRYGKFREVGTVDDEVPPTDTLHVFGRRCSLNLLRVSYQVLDIGCSDNESHRVFLCLRILASQETFAHFPLLLLRQLQRWGVLAQLTFNIFLPLCEMGIALTPPLAYSVSTATCQRDEGCGG